MSDVFISYSHKDAHAAEGLARVLEKKGLSVFFDRMSLVSGEDFSASIAREISRAKAVIVLLSEHSSRSKWVEAELQAALENSRYVVPVLLDSLATENWVWPLVGDRKAIVLEHGQDSYDLMRQVAREVTATIGRPDGPTRWLLPVGWMGWLLPFLTGFLLGGVALWLFSC